jgi:hypothetical protein
MWHFLDLARVSAGRLTLMKPDGWGYEGSAEWTERWRIVVPDFSTDPADDRTGLANNRSRAVALRRQYALELKHLGRAEGRPSFSRTRLTRISDWSPLTAEERTSGRIVSPYALCRGVPCGSSSAGGSGVDDSLDFALLVSVPPEWLPLGPPFLDGVPLAVQADRPFRLMTDGAGDLPDSFKE